MATIRSALCPVVAEVVEQSTKYILHNYICVQCLHARDPVYDHAASVVCGVAAVCRVVPGHSLHQRGRGDKYNKHEVSVWWGVAIVVKALEFNLGVRLG